MKIPILEKLNIRGITIRNRIGLAPMTMYCANNGYITDWHFVHLGSKSLKTGLVMVEATSVSSEGRITPYDLGIWSDDFVEPLKHLTSFIHNQGAIAGIQLSHGGRKSSRTRPWEGDKGLKPEDGGWDIVAPSPIPFAKGYAIPKELSVMEIDRIQEDFISAAQRAYRAGFKLIELHAGHGRLLHSFYSPIANKRNDNYGGSFENRVRFLIEIVQGIRTVWPDEYPLAVRLSCVDWLDEGWQLEDSVTLANLLREQGVDLIDCTSGGIIRPIKKSTSPGYQVIFAEKIKKKANILTAAVGLITDSYLANSIIERGDADIILFGRKMLLNPQFPLQIGMEFGKGADFFPPQYQKAVKVITTRSLEHVPEL